MLFGSKVKYGITFKTNQKSFDIWTRRYNHNFNVNTHSFDYNGAIGLPMESMDSFLVGKGDTIRFYDINTYLERTGVAIEVPLIKSETREPSEIIGLQKSHDENTIAVISGKNL